MEQLNLVIRIFVILPLKDNLSAKLIVTKAMNVRLEKCATLRPELAFNFRSYI